MGSIFTKKPATRPPTALDRIGPEIKHLKKGISVREGNSRSKAAAWIASIALLLLIGLFFMDPFLYSLRKSEAIRAYVYLHNYASASSTSGLVASGIFSKDEIRVMNDRRGTFQDYFSSVTEAENQAVTVVDFINGLHALRHGKYEQLDRLGKLRYLLFIRIGIDPPMAWSGINPSVD
jgi:hypothetical protein